MSRCRIAVGEALIHKVLVSNSSNRRLPRKWREEEREEEEKQEVFGRRIGGQLGANCNGCGFRRCVCRFHSLSYYPN